MRIEAIYSPMIVAAQTWETLAEVAGRMRFNDVGSVAVFDGDKLAGILTERDLARALVDRIDPDRTTAGDYMTPDPAVIGPESEAKEAGRIMLDLGVRHLPVVAGDRIVGVVSIRDVLQDAVWVGA